MSKPLEPLTAEHWRKMLAMQLGIVPSDEYIEKYRAVLQEAAARLVGPDD
jgi:hypothetical protein